MLRIYGIIWWLFMPLIVARLLWRSLREPGYRHHIGERFGIYKRRAPGWPCRSVRHALPNR